MIKILILLFLNTNSIKIKGENVPIYSDIERGYSAIYNGEYYEAHTIKELKKQLKNN